MQPRVIDEYGRLLVSHCKRVLWPFWVLARMARGYSLISHNFPCHGHAPIQPTPVEHKHCTTIWLTVCPKWGRNVSFPLMMQGSSNPRFSWCLLHLSNAEDVASWRLLDSDRKIAVELKDTTEAEDFPSLRKSHQRAVAAAVRSGSILQEVGDKTLAESSCNFFACGKVCVCVRLCCKRAYSQGH